MAIPNLIPITIHPIAPHFHPPSPVVLQSHSLRHAHTTPPSHLAEHELITLMVRRCLGVD